MYLANPVKSLKKERRKIQRYLAGREMERLGFTTYARRRLLTVVGSSGHGPNCFDIQFNRQSWDNQAKKDIKFGGDDKC